MDRDLVVRARAGDHAAFSDLAGREIGRLYAVARLILRDSELAADATQEALIVAWRDLSSLRDPEAFDAWLRRLLVRACYRELKAGRRRVQLESQLPDGGRVTLDPGMSIALRDQLERGFSHLDLDQRAALVFHHYLGLSMPEVAASLGWPPGTAKSRVFRATQAMRAALEADAREMAKLEGDLA